MKKLLILALLGLHFCAASEAKIGISASPSPDAVAIALQGKTTIVAYDEKEALCVGKAVNLFAEDIHKVTNCKTSIINQLGDAQQPMVVAGTFGKSRLIAQLLKTCKINAKDLKGTWERYKILPIIYKGNPIIAVIGSDKRGTAYGLMELSQKIGVSPYYWWSDLPVAHNDNLYLSGELTSASPAVKYRGIFINDEDWGITPWAARTLDKKLGNIGPRTYSKVCELLLRLRANMLGPAMHACSSAFYSQPENKVVADSFGILITTSHCEPLLLNNAAKSEWDIQKDGEWNYKTNQARIDEKWNNRLKEASKYDNIYTTAMRGLHDEGLRGNLPLDERVTLLQKVIENQRKMLSEHIGKKATEIPQIFVPYKETMAVYEAGLKVPDDITLVWVDDNYGYMKRVSNPEEQKRKGGSGVYYHLSYLGAPHDYLWVNTTPPVLMYEELKKAYDTGADRYWLLNVGDIKPMDLGILSFMDMAWDMKNYTYDRAYRFQSRYLAQTYGLRSEKDYQQLLDSYYTLAWSRKPEYMGWEREWDDLAHTGLKDTEFSFRNYSEAQSRLAEYQKISDIVDRLQNELPAEKQDAFFEQIGFPVKGSYQMNRKFLMAQLNHEQLKLANYGETNWAARQMQEAYDSIQSLIQQYSTIREGKWDHYLNLPEGFTPTTLYFKKPAVTLCEGIAERSVDLTPRKPVYQDCYVVNLGDFSKKQEADNCKIQLLNGLGYSNQVVQLGAPSAQAPSSATTISYQLPKIESDSITIIIYSVPFWPLYKGLDNRIGISLDEGEKVVFNNTFREYDVVWKSQVMRNSAIKRLTFQIDKNKASHTLQFHCVDPGQMLQRVVIDWGGLKECYY